MKKQSKKKNQQQATPKKANPNRMDKENKWKMQQFYNERPLERHTQSNWSHFCVLDRWAPRAITDHFFSFSCWFFFLSRIMRRNATIITLSDEEIALCLQWLWYTRLWPSAFIYSKCLKTERARSACLYGVFYTLMTLMKCITVKGKFWASFSLISILLTRASWSRSQI